MKELTKDIDRKEVAGIGFGGQMHGLVTLDENDQVIRPAILWNDGRTQEETEYLNNEIGKNKLSEYTANIAFAGFTTPKILWMKKNEPDKFARITKIMLPKDYLAYCLSGSFCTDVSDASGMLLLDVKNRCWSKEMMSRGVKKNSFQSFMRAGRLWELSKNPLQTSLDSRGKMPRLLQAQRTMLPLLLEQEQWETDSATSLLEPQEQSLFRVKILALMKTMLFIALSRRRKLSSDGMRMLSAASCNQWWSEEILQTKDFAAEQAPINKLGEDKCILPSVSDGRAVSSQ